MSLTWIESTQQRKQTYPHRQTPLVLNGNEEEADSSSKKSFQLSIKKPTGDSARLFWSLNPFGRILHEKEREKENPKLNDAPPLMIWILFIFGVFAADIL